MTWEAGWRYGIISTVMVGVMVSYLRLWLALWYHIYGYGWRYGIISTVMVGVMVSYLRLWLALWYHIYGYGWRYGIISTVPYEQQKIYRQIILFQRIYYLSISLTGLPCHREPSIVLMSMVWWLCSATIINLMSLEIFRRSLLKFPIKFLRFKYKKCCKDCDWKNSNRKNVWCSMGFMLYDILFTNK